MRKIKYSVLLLLVFLLISSCNLFTSSSPTPTFPPTQSAPIVSSTPAAVLIEKTPTPLEKTSVPSATSTSKPLIPIAGKINVDHFKLRTGPGFLFETAALYDEGDSVQVLGRSQGDNWLFVQTEDSRSGWMKMEYITLSGDLKDLPVVAFTDANIIQGHVKNSSGKPMSEIGIIIFPVTSQDTSNSDNAVTDETGSFTLYLPKTLKGDYTIGVNAYSCTSNAVDSQCQLNYKFPSAQLITLPNTSDVTIEFVLNPY